MLPKVDFCGLQISRLIVGANPFLDTVSKASHATLR